MYSKFNCDITDYFYNNFINKYHEKGRKIYEEFQQQSQNCLKPFLLDNGHIDGSALKDCWFSIGTADVFISHSHNDIEKVKAFAGWLNDAFGLTVFIDSCAWGYCDDLLKLIDDKYCKHKDGKTYDYQLRNYTTSHVHSMLSAALVEMIDKTECLIFYNTPQSIYLENELKEINKNNKTLSPWIYHELSTSNTIHSREPRRLIQLRESFEHLDSRKFTDSSKPQIEYDVSTIINNMPKLDDSLLIKWQSQYNGKKHEKHALDVLYRLVSPK